MVKSLCLVFADTKKVNRPQITTFIYLLFCFKNTERSSWLENGSRAESEISSSFTHSFPLLLKMDRIHHNFIQVGALKLHVAEIGTGNHSSHRQFLHRNLFSLQK